MSPYCLINRVYSIEFHTAFRHLLRLNNLHLTALSKELHLLLLYPCHSFSDAQAPELLLHQVDTDT